MKQQLLDYGHIFMHVPIKCNNTSTINLTKNSIQYFGTKHKEIKHHFIRYHVNMGDIVLYFVNVDKQLGDMFTKPLNKDKFHFIRNKLEICNLL